MNNYNIQLLSYPIFDDVTIEYTTPPPDDDIPDGEFIVKIHFEAKLSHTTYTNIQENHSWNTILSALLSDTLEDELDSIDITLDDDEYIRDLHHMEFEYITHDGQHLSGDYINTHYQLQQECSGYSGVYDVIITPI